MTRFVLPGGGLDSQFLFSIMTYPEDESARQALAIAGGFNFYTHGEDGSASRPVTNELIRLLAASDGYQNVLERASNNAANAQIAGFAAVALARMNLSGHPEPSLNSAFKIAERYYNNAKAENGQLASASRPKIREYWNKYQPVIHLWAAYVVCNDLRTSNYIENFEIHRPEMMTRFLGIAEWFGHFLEQYQPSRQPIRASKPQTLIKSGTLFKLEHGYPPQEPEITWETLEDWMIEELNAKQ